MFSVPGVLEAARDIVAGGRSLRSNGRVNTDSAGYGLRKLSGSSSKGGQAQRKPPGKGGKPESRVRIRNSGNNPGRVVKRTAPGRRKSPVIPAIMVLDGSINELLTDVKEKHVQLVLSRVDRKAVVDQQCQTSSQDSDELECQVKTEVSEPQFRVSTYHTTGTLMAAANAMGFKEVYFTGTNIHPELRGMGLTDYEWDQLVAFFEMVQGNAVGNEKEGSFTELMNWLRQRLELRKSTGGAYGNELDAYIDFCLQYMALRYGKQELYIEQSSYYLNAEMNRIVHLQGYAEKFPGKSWSDFEKERRQQAFALAHEILSKPKSQDMISYEQLEAAMKSSDVMSPEDLGGEWTYDK